MGPVRRTMQLLLLGSLTGGSCGRSEDETVAIQQLLEQESATWRTGDVAGRAACWYVAPNSRILVSTADGQFLNVPPARMLAPSPALGQGGSSVNTNYRMQIAGPAAWVSHDEESTARNG